MIKSDIMHRIQGLVIVISCLLLFSSPQRGDQLSGKYGLYIHQLDDKQWEINWITPIMEQGIFKLSNHEGESKQILTERSRTHKTTIPAFEKPVMIIFGGKNSGTYQLKLVPDIKEQPDEIKGVDSIYALGDVHGAFDETVNLMQTTNLINDEMHWTGGKSHVVFVGDVLDRGQDCTRLMWLIYELEQEAKVAGGGVHLVLGNHEIMVMSNDLRYVSEKEKQIAETYQISYSELYHPTQSYLGKWVSSKPTIFKIDGVLFAHGGIITDYGNYSAKVFNDSSKKFIREPVFRELMKAQPDTVSFTKELLDNRLGFFYSSYSPFWFRGYVLSDTLELYLDHILTKFQAKVHVVGHTSGPQVRSRYKGKLIATNVDKSGTEMLLIVRKKRKYKSYRIDSLGNFTLLKE